VYIRPNLDRILSQALLLVFLAALVGIIYNLVNPQGIPMLGTWSPKILPGGVIAPPSYTEGEDAPVINLSEAQAALNSGQAIFLDARKAEDYRQGHITGAVQLFLEEFDTQYPRVKDRLPQDQTIITYCDGDDCELSLFLARNLQFEGYEDVRIFFGGWKEWKEAGLPITIGEGP
jgi:rhodanese-related sulfurtransferase